MAHPLIAQRCIQLMAESGVTRSKTATELLTCLCKDQSPPLLDVRHVRDMLTKRGLKPNQRDKTPCPTDATETQEEQERYARLILDIQQIEGGEQSASVLLQASNWFKSDPFFPQALARFYYTELKKYHLAEMWAKRATLRDPRNSFVADTLGQVYKNQLKKAKRPLDPHVVLQLASKASEAFKEEEILAENERKADMTQDGNARVSRLFNTRGQFGYLQLCNDLFDLLVSQNDAWRDVLTKKVLLNSALERLGDPRLIQFNDLINSLRDDIETKCAFFNKYVTYSTPKFKNDPDYISEDTSKCYENFVGSYPSEDFKQKGAALIRRLKKKRVDTSVGVFSCLERECKESDLKDITTWWEEIFLQRESINCVVALVELRNKCAEFPADGKLSAELKQKMSAIPGDSPELCILALLLCWPADGEATGVLDLSRLIQRIKRSFRDVYELHLGSRYLRPLFFMGKGKGLGRMVHRKVLENLLLEQNPETKRDWINNWCREKIFQDPKVQKDLVKVEGVVRHYRLFTTAGGREIELEANDRDSLWRPRAVSFYLGFTIRGPVAFAVRTEKPPCKASDTGGVPEKRSQAMPFRL
ncbi:sterile alpha motif domain-containing protein 9-like [Spinachia spinachia]